MGISTQSLNKEYENIELPDNSTVSDLIDKIWGKVNDPIDRIKSATFLVNKSRANKDTVLKDGDEVMILLVLGGG